MKTPKNGFAQKLSDTINRTFDGLPVVDAESDMRLVVLEEDIEQGSRKSFERCIFAQACNRQFGSTKVLLMRTIAYIALPDEGGNMRVERFIISPHGRELIKKYDRGERIDPEASFVFKSPPPSNRLEYRRAYEKRRRKEQRKARMRGEADYQDEEEDRSHMHSDLGEGREVDVSVRNGTGLIQMRRKKVEDTDEKEQDQREIQHVG